jgi:periplasmic divalent cation tolerance protein
MNSFVVIETTFSSHEEGLKMASMLVQQHLCACCHIMNIQSCFRYKGTVQNETEVLLRCKTTRQSQSAAIECIVSHHSYSVPEIVVMEVSCPHVAYATWIEDEVQQKGI